MCTCILCLSVGKERRYFFPGKPLCDLHYSGYLEYVIEEFEEEVTTSNRESAYGKYKITLEPKPASVKQKSAPSTYRSPFKMGR
jgi:hypothetical protein